MRTAGQNALHLARWSRIQAEALFAYGLPANIVERTLPKVSDPFEALSVGGLNGNGLRRKVTAPHRDSPGPARPSVSGNDQHRLKLAAFDHFGAAHQLVVFQPINLSCNHGGHLRYGVE